MQATIAKARCAIRPIFINAALLSFNLPRTFHAFITCTMSPPKITSTPMATGSKRPAPDSRPISPPPSKRKTAQPSISKTTVANFFTPASQKPKEPTVWTERSPDGATVPTLLVAKYVSPDEQPDGQDKPVVQRRKIAAFDLDSTLITPASGKKHADGPGDWKWWHHSVPTKLRQLYDEEFLVIIFTNQGGLTLYPDPKAKAAPKNHKTRVPDFKAKCNHVLSHLNIPEITVYAATGKDMFRKPRTGMWEEMLKDYGLAAEEINLHESIFVGDAGGRLAQLATPATATNAALKALPKDFSCSDRNMASNIGIPFATPEEFFLGAEPRKFVREFDPENWPFCDPAKQTEDFKFEKKNAKEVVLFVGPPGAGKSSFFRDHLKPLGYERINQDILKTRDKCFKAAENSLKAGESVVIDNTNADPETRALWVELARKHKVPIRCVWFKTPLELCAHNDAVRGLNKTSAAHNPEARELLSQTAFIFFRSKFKEPKEKEGFEQVVPVEFKFRGSEEDYKVWARYWV